MSVINDDIRVGGDMDRITKLVNCFPNGIKLSIWKVKSGILCFNVISDIF